MIMPDLPVTEVLEALSQALANQGAAVLVAPPGAGKTTLVPLHLLNSIEGKIILLEPLNILSPFFSQPPNLAKCYEADNLEKTAKRGIVWH